MITNQKLFWHIPEPSQPNRKEKLEESQKKKKVINLSSSQISAIIRIYNKTPFEKFQEKCDQYRRDKEEENIPICYNCYHNLLEILAQEEDIISAYNSSRLDDEIKTVYSAVFRETYPELKGETKENNIIIQKMSIMAHIEKMLFMFADEIQGKTKKKGQK